jgi:hypothetical protein
MDILYYSNYCKHSQKLLQTLVKANLSDKISFICIDKRAVDKKSNQIYVLLENGGKVIVPPNIHSVPSLLLVKQSYKVILGDEILKHYHPQIKSMSDVATRSNGEPMGFYLEKSNNGTNISSEKYTLYSMTPDDLSAKGKGGMRQMYNYVSASDDINLINTPPDTYRPDKVSNSVTIDTLQQKRMDDITQVAPKQSFANMNIVP